MHHLGQIFMSSPKPHLDLYLSQNLCLRDRFSTSFGYYGLSMDLQKFGVDIYLIQVIFGAVDFPAKVIINITMSYCGRRLSQCGGLVLAGITILSNLLVPYGM